MIQKNPTSREERENEDCGHAVYRSWCVVCAKDRSVEKHLQVELLEEEERERTNPRAVFDCVFLTQENADTTLEHENEPRPEVFQEVKIYSCVEVVVRKVKRHCRTSKISAERNTSARITDDIPLLNWIPHFAMRFLNKMRTGRRWKKLIAQFGAEELISFMKHIIQGMFVGHHDRTKTISYIAKCGLVRGKSWTRQILSDAWELTKREDSFGNPLNTVIAERN